MSTELMKIFRSRDLTIQSIQSPSVSFFSHVTLRYNPIIPQFHIRLAHLRINICEWEFRARVKLRRERSEARSERRERTEEKNAGRKKQRKTKRKKKKKKKGANRIKRVRLQAKVKRGEKHASATLPVHTPGASWPARRRPFYHWAHNQNVQLLTNYDREIGESSGNTETRARRGRSSERSAAVSLISSTGYPE